MINPEAIRPIYTALKDWLTAATDMDESSFLDDPALWEPYLDALGELGQLTGKNYRRYAPAVQDHNGRPRVSAEDYLAKLDRLVFELHRKYFSEEPLPYLERSDRRIIHLLGGGLVFKIIQSMGYNEPDLLNNPMVQKSLEAMRRKLKKQSVGRGADPQDRGQRL